MFLLEEKQKQEIAEWKKNHPCTVTVVGAIGGKYTYKFTPTGLGTVAVVACHCGAEINITDFNEW